MSSKISELNPAGPLSGVELLEVVQANGQGVLENRKVTLDDLRDGVSAYDAAVRGGYTGTKADFDAAMAGGFGKGGAVFITAIAPVDSTKNVGDIVFDQDGTSITDCSTTTQALRVTVKALTGYSRYKPGVKVNGQPVTMTATSDAPVFTGTIDITLGQLSPSQPGMLMAEHEDGAFWQTSVTMESAPVITSAVFVSPYPSSQTALKAGDTMTVRVVSDAPVTGYEIKDIGAFVAASGTFASGTTHDVNGLVIAGRTSPSTEGFQIRVKKANGSFSAWYDTTTHGSTELREVVKLDNTFPSVTITGVTYPANKTAIGTGDSVTVNHNILGADTYTYDSPTSELFIPDPTVFSTGKAAQWVYGDYNASTPNWRVTAKKSSNGAITVRDTIVKISNVKPTISITLPQARLRSGGNAGTSVQNYLVTLTSTQALAEAPTLNLPEGTWADPQWTANTGNTVWTRRIAVHDNNAKGTFSFNSLSAKSLSGLVQNTIASGGQYVLGGFVFRTLTVAAYPNKEVAIGTSVGDTAKLRCSNLSKGSSGSLNYTYQSANTAASDKYTIAVNAGNDHWVNLDIPNASSNTAGLMQIELEEVV